MLNINELANALKPVVLPGEFMRVFILKEGKEYNQGVAYLDDGTMVVVDNARKLIGKNVDVTVTSVLQTTAGKMIFGKDHWLQGVQVLNINELANALKSVVLPGEFMRVFILKEGKEYNQGVAYLDDGTMVVVDNARKLIGKNVDVTVTSVLQTTAGKMIFGKAIESHNSAVAGEKG